MGWEWREGEVAAVGGHRGLFRRTNCHLLIHLKAGKLSILIFFPSQTTAMAFKEDSNESVYKYLCPGLPHPSLNGRP